MDTPPSSHILSGYDPAILNADDPVSELSDLLIVGDHNDGLRKFLTGQL
jgi:hypothetical protein